MYLRVGFMLICHLGALLWRRLTFICLFIFDVVGVGTICARLVWTTYFSLGFVGPSVPAKIACFYV